MPSNHLIPSIPLLLLPSVFPSIRDFLCIRWPKYWNFSINPSNEYSGLISPRIVWFDLLAVQGTLKSLLHNSKAAVLQHSGFFIVKLSHANMTTGKTIALTIQMLHYWLSAKEFACNASDTWFDSWVRKIPWRRKWQPTPVFLPGESQGQRSLAGYSPWGHKSWTRLSD